MQKGESRRTFNVENILSFWINELVLKSFKVILNFKGEKLLDF